MSGVGLSQVNFDVQGLEDDEEQQLEKEDEERERELHELLSNELPEELLDDDNLSFSSQGLSNSTHGHRTPEFNLDQSFDHHDRADVQDAGIQEGTTGYYPHEHALLTHRGEEFIRRSEFPSSGTSHESVTVVHPDSVPRGYGFGGGVTYGYGREPGEHRGYDENNGGEYLDQGNKVHGNQGYLGTYGYQSDGTSHVKNGLDDGGGLANGGYYQGGDYTKTDDYENGYPLADPTGTNASSDLVLPPDAAGTRPVYPLRDQNFNEVYPNHGGRYRLQPEPYDTNDTFKVEYTRNRSLDVSETELKDQGETGDQSNVGAPSSELAQLQVIHRARGRKLEELAKEIAMKEKEYEKQIRILNHHLSLMKGERDGMASSLKHAQEVATDRKQDVDGLQKRLHDLEMVKEKTSSEKDETESELEAAKKTIESLHQQLMELEKSESLSRAREQHESVVMATRKRYEEDVVRLKQKLDDVNNTLLWKGEESKRLHDELTQARKDADRVRLDRAETVNRLTRSLEQSQRQNEELLKAGSTQKISHLQSQLQLTQREKIDLEEHYKTMETDLVDLKEQLRTYESVSKFDMSTKNETTVALDATYNLKRNLADEWRTPVPGSSRRDFSTEEALTGLQKELQLCLARNRSKREEIEQLRSQLDVVKKELANEEVERARIEMVVKKQEVKVLEQEKKIADLEELTKHPERRDEYRESELMRLKTAVEEYAPKVEQFIKREEELEQLNLQLKSQMSEMVREYDTDKQKSIEECRQSCLQFHDEAMNSMKQQLKQEHEEQVKKLRIDLESVSSELDQAKESYVVLSEETRWIEKQTRERCEEETKQKIDELRAKWDQEKSCEMVDLRQSVVTEMEGNFAKEKGAWQKNEEEMTRGKIEAEIALAKMGWAQDQEKRRQDAVTSALRLAKKQWMENYNKMEASEVRKQEISDMKIEWEKKKEKEFEQKMVELRNVLKSEMTKEHDRKLGAAREEWERVKTTDIERVVEKAKRNWDKDVKKLDAEAKESSVALAKADWSREQAEIRQTEIAEKIEEVKAEALAAAKKDLERNYDMRIENILQSEKTKWRAAADEEIQHALETAVLLAEEEWRTEHQNKISEAVKEALAVAQNSWGKERENAIESAVAQSLDSAKETWDKSKVQEIEQILSAARQQWFKEFGVFRQESTPGSTISGSRESLATSSTEETNKTFSYLETQYTKSLKDFRENELKRVLEEYEGQKCSALKELESKYEMKLKELEENQHQKVSEMVETSTHDRKAQLKHLETAYQKKFQELIDEIEEKYRQEKEAMEKDWVEKYERERRELEEAYRAKFEKEREGMGRELQEKYESGIEKVRRKLEHQLNERLQSAVEGAKHGWEAEQEEDRVALEEQHMMKLEGDQKKLRQEMEEQAEAKLSQARTDALVVTRQLEEDLKNEKTRCSLEIETLRCELRDVKQRLNTPKDRDAAIAPGRQRKNVDEKNEASQTDCVRNERWTSLAEISDELPSNGGLYELRKQYLATAAQLKEDFMQHAVETRKNAAKAIRSEVMKERHATAKRLRKYYLECLKQILDDDKEAFKNNQNPRSNQEKMRIMEDNLRLPDEKDESFMSSTLTDVTALPDSTSEHHPIAGRTKVINGTANTSPRGKPRHNNQDNRPAQNNASGDTQTRTRPPRSSVAENSRNPEVVRTDCHEQAGNEWVNYSRGGNYGEAIDAGVKPPVLQGGKVSSKGAYGTNPTGLFVSSTDSLLSIDDGRRINLPPAINFRQQQIPDRLLRPEEGEESETSSSTGLSDSSKDATRWRGAKSHERGRSNCGRHGREHERGKSDRVRHFENSERPHKVLKLTRTSKDSTAARSQADAARTSPGQFSHPVIAIKSRNEQPAKLTSSLLRPISDVLPSKPLSPVARASPKFSYTMHSGSHKTK